MAALAQALYAPRKLRVAVFADGARQPRWIVEALAKVASSEFAELAAVCVDTTGAVSRPPLLWQAYCRADRSLFGAASWSEPREIAVLVPRSRRLSREEIAAEGPFDVVFALGESDDASLASFARYGVWRYCFGEGQGTNEPLAGVREVIDAAPVTAAAIRIHRGGGAADRIACQSWSRTLAFSVVRSRDNVFAKATEFVARALRQLHRSGESWLETDTVPATARTSPRFPGPGGLVRDLSCMGTRVARRAAEKLFTVEQWSLAFRFDDQSGNHGGHGDQLLEWSGSLDGWFRLEPPKDRFWADPFPIQRNGKSYIFFEELPFAAGKAHLSVIEVDRSGRASEPVRVLERDYHLSYPFLVEEGGELYMIPETAGNQTIEIYRCVEFPGKWRRERVLVDNIFAADATVHREGGRWWMFANATANGAEIHDELHLFSAPALLGPWTPHARNPVKSDVRSARPAGRLFRRGNELFRPGQVCAPLYGSGIAVNRVTRLDDQGFAEEEVRRIVPAPGCGVLGLHTLNSAGGLTVTDAFIRRSRF